MEIPPGGIVVRLMPVVDQQLPSSPPPSSIDIRFKKNYFGKSKLSSGR